MKLKSPIGKLARNALWFNRTDNRFDFNGNNRNLNYDNRAREIAQSQDIIINMETTNLYPKIYNLSNLILAWRKARKGKTKMPYVKEFEKNLIENLLKLHYELKNQTYSPLPLQTFSLRDPKTRKISKSDFRDRIIHHAIVKILEPIFERIFIFDSCANRKGKGNLCKGRD